LSFVYTSQQTLGFAQDEILLRELNNKYAVRRKFGERDVIVKATFGIGLHGIDG
jgi:hypothetical protein